MYSCNYRSPVLLNTCQRMDLSMVVLQLRIVWVSVHDNACTYVRMYTVPSSHAITSNYHSIPEAATELALPLTLSIPLQYPPSPLKHVQSNFFHEHLPLYRMTIGVMLCITCIV